GGCPVAGSIGILFLLKWATYRFVITKLSGSSGLLLAVSFLVVILASCSGLKKSSTTTTTPKDTSKVGAVATIDSVTNDIGNAIGKVGDFLGSIVPGSLFGGGKDSIMLIPPKNPEINPSVDLEPPTKLAYPPSQLERRLEFDSLGHVTVHDEFLGGDANIPQTYTLDDYLTKRQADGVQEGLLKSAQTYTSTGGSGAASGGAGTGQPDQGKGVLSDYNTVSIPIPPSIVPTIFGKPAINLQVNGDVAIHLAYRDNQFLQTTGTLLSGSETGLDFRQEVNMNIKGSIGDKVKINTDFGSLRQFNFDNIFNLSYKGYPDEIIQSVDAGNISLTTPSKYIGIQSGLFGFKGVMRFGPWYLTALAAQKKADRQTKSFGGGPGSSGGSDFVIQPANFRKNMYFLDTLFKPRFEQVYSTIPPQSLPKLIQDGTVEVWRSTNQTDIRKMSGYCAYNLPSNGGAKYDITQYNNRTTDHDLFESGYIIKVDTSQYSVDYQTGIITLYQEPSDYDFIAVSYQSTGVIGPAGQIGDRIGDGQDTAMVLKLIKPKQLFTTTNKRSWTNLLKNNYYVGATNIDQKGFSIKIQYTYPTGQVSDQVRSAAGLDKAITVTGLDRYENSTSAPRPDGLFDVISNGASSPLLNSRAGTLIFPYLEPFGKRILDYQNEQARKKPGYKRDSTFYFPEIYTQSPAYWASSSGYSTPKNNEMSINVRYNGGTSSVLNLNAFNIVEGSVRVTAGGRQLTEGVDYRVDINSGTVTLLKPDLATAGQISVDYDTHDIFTTSTKTLVGLRAELPLGDQGLFGTTLMNYSMHLPTIKTRQGEEPLSNWILGGDLSYKVPTPFLTNWMNALPIFNLHDKSDINFKFDGAFSMPNPNTQASPMGVDNGKSIAYLDDFEGGRTETPLSMSYGRWVHSSQPVFPNPPLSGLTPKEINERKSKMWWYQAQPQDTKITDIKPNKSVASSSEYAQVLDLVFDPTPPFIGGIYNHDPNTTAPNEDRWAGMMQYQQGLNVLASNTDAIEFWMNIPNAGNTPGGMLHFDMGRMSEDVIPDGHLETEDKNGNGRYDPGEDVGLDTMRTDTESIVF
ncbi:MAG TPA: cell surface protein SprA, partial [Candidatus Kapabacteria bacterium]|nr:cell surface protein SprA [Candidatus Kapabacteria bacterium]